MPHQALQLSNIRLQPNKAKGRSGTIPGGKEGAVTQLVIKMGKEKGFKWDT